MQDKGKKIRHANMLEITICII